MENLIETQLTSEEIFDGRILHLYNDTVRLPNGKTAPREVTRHVGAVCVVPLLDDGRVIVERQFRYPVNEVITEIPAGKRDSKDEDPELAARRELREELGLTLDLSQTVAAVTLSFDGGFDDYFLADCDVPLSALTLQAEEVQAARWAGREEIQSMIARREFAPFWPSFVDLLFDLHRHRGLSE